MSRHSDWVASDNDDNAASTATKAAETAPVSHYITSISASYSSTKSGQLLQLKEDTTELARWYVYDHIELVFDNPIKLSPGTALNCVLAASGTGGVVGAVTVTGYSL